MGKGNEIIRGLSGNKGTVTCKIRIIESDPEATTPVTAKLMAVKPGECLVGVKFTPEQNNYLKVASALIQNTGGKASHGNVFCMARGKPAVYNTQGIAQTDGSILKNATEVLKDGQTVVVEGYVETIEEEMPDGRTKRRDIGVIYEYVPEAGAAATKPPAKKPTLEELMEKYGMRK